MRHRIFPLCLLLAFALLPEAALLPAADAMTKLTITVRTQGGHAIENAEVIVRWNANKKHPAARYGRAVNTTFEMRSNQEGQAKVPAIPQGSILIQVNAKGYQTFGKVFDISEDEKTLEVTLNPPQQQYSAHQ